LLFSHQTKMLHSMPSIASGIIQQYFFVCCQDLITCSLSMGMYCNLLTWKIISIVVAKL
jgi:hypothetical protein